MAVKPENPVPAWRFCVGTGRFELALRRDYQDSLALLQKEIGFRHIRGHGLFSDGVGLFRPYDSQGTRGVHHVFTYVDQVIDAYLSLGIAPFLELGLMPSELASGDQTVFWWRGNVTPPRSHGEWAELVRATLRHLVGRYGLEQVRTWPIEVWNEPDFADLWAGADEAAYHRLYEVTAHAVKEVDAGLTVGGPVTSSTGDEWLPRFADFVDTRGVPIDFVSKHAYAAGPARHLPFGTRQTVHPAARLLEQFATPRELLRGTALDGLPVHITEFNSSYRPDNPLHDTAFHAWYLAPVLVFGGDHVDSFSYWTFCDVFEEVGVPASIFHGGFGLLTHRQLKKPAFHLYAFMARLGAETVDRGEDYVVTRDADGRVAILAWGSRLKVTVACGPVREVFMVCSSVSETKGNVHAAWEQMGRPASPTSRQLETLRELAEPARTHARVAVTEGRAEIALTLDRHEVMLIELTAVHDETPEWWEDYD